MATDLNGRTIATGEQYLVGGVVRKISGDEVVLVMNNGLALHVDAGDIVQAEDTRQLIPVRCAAFDLGATVTALIMRTELNNLIHNGASGVVQPFNATLVGIAADAAHSHGSDPGNWTFTAQKRSTTGTLLASSSLSLSMATSGYANHNISTLWDIGSPISFTKDTHVLLVSCTGPSTVGPFITVNMIFRRDP